MSPKVMRAMISVVDPMVVKGRTTPHYKAALAILQVHSDCLLSTLESILPSSMSRSHHLECTL